ncbi:MAG: hypothetical protein ABSG67_18405 [Thermoguttaceae bacterium]|jgi:hypothetical protein
MSFLKGIFRLFSAHKEDDPTLQRWKSAETRKVKKARDPRTKYCVANIGKEITIKYYGTSRTIKPIRVFTKPMYRKTYVEAEEKGEHKTFDIDDMELTSASAGPSRSIRRLVAGRKRSNKQDNRKRSYYGCGCLLIVIIFLWFVWRILS